MKLPYHILIPGFVVCAPALAGPEHTASLLHLYKCIDEHIAVLKTVQDKPSADTAAQKIPASCEAICKAFQSMDKLEPPDAEELMNIASSYRAIHERLQKEYSACARPLLANNCYGSTSLQTALEPYPTLSDLLDTLSDRAQETKDSASTTIPEHSTTQSDEERRRHDRFMQEQSATFSGGNGLSMETAIRLHSPHGYDAVAKENMYLDSVYPGCQAENQSLLSGKSGRMYDRIEIRTKNGTKMIYFDVTDDLKNLREQTQKTKQAP